MNNPIIKNVKVIMTEPENIRLVIVKIETNEPGLYGVDVQHLPKDLLLKNLQ